MKKRIITESRKMFVGPFLTALIILTFEGCGNHDPTSVRGPTPVISAFSPDSGVAGLTTVTLTGNNFGVTANETIVNFNGTLATITASSDTQLTTELPMGATTGKITVAARGTTGISTNDFTVILVTVSTFAGSVEGYADEKGAKARFNFPAGIAIDHSGNIYVADVFNCKIRKIASDGNVTTLAGSTEGSADGQGVNAQFYYPRGVGVDADGNVYVADSYGHKIRKITPDGMVSTLVGTTQGFADGQGSQAKFDSPMAVAADSSGNIYVSDFNNNKIRKITPDGTVSTLAGSTQGFADGKGANAQFYNPYGIALDGGGNVYVTDRNYKIRKITPDGNVSTLAGSTEGFADGKGTNAQFDYPAGIAMDNSGNIYVTDVVNSKIRKVTPDGTVSTLAGGPGYADGQGGNAGFASPLGIAVDGSGNLYVADTQNQLIRKIVIQ